MRTIFIAFFAIMITACSTKETTFDFDLQGHRGARGLLPENTIPGFLEAVDLGVDTIELDVVVTADDRILVSHEPWFNHEISTKPDGIPVSEEEEMELNIYEMTYEETQQFDVGMREHPRFPEQKKMSVQKPLLEDAIRAVEHYIKEQELNPVQYNIETKSEPDLYGIYYPQPSRFASLLHDLLMKLDEEFNLEERIIIQSFDPNTLIEFHTLNPDIRTAMLVFEDQPMQSYIERLGFTPEIWSPDYELVTTEIVEEAHKRGMKVIPWTVKRTEEMRSLLEMGVDGIITDYPNRAAELH